MGVFDKVKFWKREEEPANAPPEYDLGAQQFDANNPMGMPMTSPDPLAQHDPLGASMSQQGDQMFAASQQPYPQQYPQQGYPGGAPFPGSPQQAYPGQVPAQEPPDQIVHPRDIELILAKLDSIKSEIDALHQRVRKIEQYYDAQTQQKRYW